MSKCIVDANALDIIRSDAYNLVEEYYDNENSTPDSLTTSIKELINNLRTKDDYLIDASNIDMIALTIYEGIHEDGGLDEDSATFNKQTYKSWIDYVSSGGTLNLAVEASAMSKEDVDAFDFITPSEFLTGAYGDAYDVQRRAELEVKGSLVDAFFINRGSIEGVALAVVSPTEMNRNIRIYRLQLLNKICEYLKTKEAFLPLDIIELINNPILYDESGKYTEICIKLQPYINKYLGISKINSRQLRSLLASIDEKDKLKLDAYNANVFFTHFDQYIKAVFPNAISIKSTERGKKISSDDKYRLGDKSTGQANTTHRKTDEISEDELDAVTRIYIETSPVYTFNGEQETNDKLNFGLYQNILGKIKFLGIKPLIREIVLGNGRKYRSLLNSLTPLTREFFTLKIHGETINLALAINLIRLNPRQYLHSIFELLSNKQFYELFPQVYSDFLESELNHLYSSYMSLFKEGSRDINDTKIGLRGLVGLNPEIDYYHYVTLTSDSIFRNEFIQYTKDEYNNLVLRKAIDQVRIRKRRLLVNSINSIGYNNLKNSFDLYNLKLNKEFNKATDNYDNYISFTIPNTDININVMLDLECKYTNTSYSEELDFNKLINNQDVLLFIDDVLGLDLINNSDYLKTMNSEDPTFALKKLTWLASNVLTNSYVFDNQSKDLDNNSSEEEKLQSKKVRLENSLKKLYNNREFRFLKNSIRAFDLIPSSQFAENVLQLMITTQMNLEGLTTSTLIKNSQGNAQSNLSLSKLLGSYPSLWDLLERAPESATQHLSILNVPGLFQNGSWSTTEFYDNRSKTLKSATKFIVSELAYSAIMANYIPALMPQALTNSTVKHGVATFLASVNSDKNTINQLPFDLTVPIDVNGRAVPIIEMSDYDLKWAMCKDFGGMNLKILLNITKDFDLLANFIRKNPEYSNLPKIDPVNFNDFNKFCEEKKISPFDLIYNATLEYNNSHRLNPINIVEDLYFRKDGKKIAPNTLLLSQIARFAPKSANDLGINLSEYYSYDEFFKEKEKEIVYSLLKNNVSFDLLCKMDNDPNLDSVKKFIKESLPDWVNQSDNMIIAKVNVNGTVYNISKKYDVNKIALLEKIDVKDVYNYIFELNPYIKRYNRLEYWLTQSWMATTVGTFIDHPGKKVFTNAKTYFKNIEKANEKINLLKAWVALAELSPEKNIAEILRTNNEIKLLEQEISLNKKEISILWEAAAFLDLHKRNVLYTAQMNEFSLNSLNGIPLNYNVAPIKSLSVSEIILEDPTCDVSPNDGATMVHGVINHLENNSLGGNKAGVDKKLFVHFKYERTGTSGIDKTAGFAVTNDRIRRSPDGWGHMNYQMMNHRWRKEALDESGNEQLYHPNEVDLLTDFRGNSILYKNRYFAKNGKLYVIDDIIRRELTPEEIELRKELLVEQGLYGLPIIGYERVIYSVDYEGNKLERIPASELEMRGIESISVLATNYDVWKFFGGEYSLAKNNFGKLRPSESSFENLTLAVNNVGTVRINPNTGVEYTSDRFESQEQIWQFMKYSDIHYMPDSGSMKHGIANVNPTEKYLTKDLLNFLQIKMYLAGIQLDKEHHADDSEVSLPTLIVNACSALGYTIDTATELYNALSSAANLGIKNLINAAKLEYNENDISKLRSEVMKLISEELASGKDTNNFAAVIAKSIVERVRKDPKNEKYGEGLNQLPLSDRTVMAKMISTISSVINKSAIKIKLPGILAVISPVHDLYKLYGDKTYDSFDNPEVELQILQENYKNNPIFLAELAITDSGQPIPGINLLYNLKLGRNYTFELANGNEITDLIKTPNQLRKIKLAIANNQIVKIYENIGEGRNLGAYNVIFEAIDENGRKSKYQLWELDSINDIHELKLLKDDGEIENDQDVRNWWFNRFNETTNLKYDQAIKVLSRRLQLDLYNLSKTSENKVEKFNQLCNALVNSLTTEEIEYNLKQLNRWIYAELGKQQASEIYARIKNLPGGLRNQVLYDIVYPIIADKQAVYIDGKKLIPDKRNLEIEPYEIIMPKIFLELFGFEEFTDLNKVKDDKDYFVKQYIRNRNLVNGSDAKPNENLFDIELLSSNGLHIFIMTSDHLPGSNLVKSDAEILIKEVNGEQIRVDFDDNPMYQIPEGTEIYLDAHGNEVLIVPNNLDEIDSMIASMSFDTINFSLNLKNYGDFAVQLAKKLADNSKLSVREFFDQQILTDKNLDSNQILANFKNAYVYGLTEENYLNPEFKKRISHIIKAGRRKHASFLKSLEIVAGRIPSLSLLSFMPMKVVAYENPNRNSTYVSNLQLLLLGSDLDIDAVTLITYDINNRGFIELWSPYSNIEYWDNTREITDENGNKTVVTENPLDLINASMELPYPNNTKITYRETENVDEVIEMLSAFKDAINWNRDKLYFRTHTAYHLRKVAKVLKYKDFVRPTKEKMSEFVTRAEELIDSWAHINTIDKANQIFDRIKELVDAHNLYLRKKPNYFVKRTLNNYITYAMYLVSSDPVNQRLAQVPVDAITEPLKQIASDSDSAKDVFTRTPGTFIGKLESIDDNAQGKDCVGISAVGIKSYFTLTQYYNTVLNEGTEEDLERLLGNLKFQLLSGRKGDTRTLLANIRSKDPSTITNNEVLDLLLSTETDEDLALTLSALLSLSVDNAKELSLANLNAGSTMIGTYIYGICIGMDFRDISRILMSPTAKMLKEVMDNNSMTTDPGYFKLADTFKYFEKIPWSYLFRYNKHITSWDQLVAAKEAGVIQNYNTPMSELSSWLFSKFNINTSSKGQVSLKKMALDDNVFEELNKFRILGTQGGLFYGEDIKLFNQMIDFLEDYVILYRTINFGALNLFKKLVHGALEMFNLGQIVGLNQGIPTDFPGLLTKCGFIENALYDAWDNRLVKLRDEKPNVLEWDNLSDEVKQELLDPNTRGKHITKNSRYVMKINLKEFVENPNYRSLCIDLYEPLKMSFNILDIIDKLPHVLGYVEKLELVDRANSLSYNYRQAKTIYSDIAKLYKIPKLLAVKAINKYIGDLNILDWQILQEPFIKLPSGSVVFNPNGTMSEPIKSPIDLLLGTDYTNATFRYWMENEFIPNLKKGNIVSELANNFFVKGLTNDIRTNVNSGNGPVIYTVKANLLPRTALELNIFDQYADAFAQLEGYNYQENGNNIPITDLFIQYALIAHDGLLAENSLMSLFKSPDLQNTGLLGDYHDFIIKMDRNKPISNLNEFLQTSLRLNLEDSNPQLLENLLFTKYATSNGDYSLFSYVFDENLNLNVLARKIRKGEDADKGLKGRKKVIFETTIDANMFPDLQVNENTIYIPNNQVQYGETEVDVIDYDIRINKADNNSVDIIMYGEKQLHYEGLVNIVDDVNYEFVVDLNELIKEEVVKDVCKFLPY